MYSKILIFIGVLISFVGCQENEKVSSALPVAPQQDSIPKKKVNPYGGELFDDSKVHEIFISFPQETWEDLLLENKQIKDRTYRSKYLLCNVKVDSTELFSCGIRFKGESSYQYYPSKKKSFRLKFNEFNKKQKCDGVKGVSLNNNFKDPSMIREKLILDFYEDHNVVAQRASFTKVYLNGEYYGLYTMLECIDKGFMKNNFGKSKKKKQSVFVQGKPRASLKYLDTDTLLYKRSYSMKKKERNLKHVINLTRSIHDGLDLEKKIDLKSVYENFAINNLFVNIDAYNLNYTHNYFLFKKDDATPFTWINYDFNYGFGAWSPTHTLKDMEQLSAFFLDEKNDNPLWVHILNTPELKKEYIKVYIDLLEKFNMNDFEKSIRKYEALLAKPVQEDTLKMYSTEAFHLNMIIARGDVNDPGAFSPGLINFMSARKKFLLKELRQ